MKILPSIADTRGRESHTLFFIAAAIAVLLPKFALAGMRFGEIVVPPMTAGEFGAAFSLIMAIWLGREWTEKKT